MELRNLLVTRHDPSTFPKIGLPSKPRSKNSNLNFSDCVPPYHVPRAIMHMYMYCVVVTKVDIYENVCMSRVF